MNIKLISNIRDFERFLCNEEIDNSIKNPEILYFTNEGVLFINTPEIKRHKIVELTVTSYAMRLMIIEAKNNKYIPIYDKDSGGLLFSKEQFLKLRKKMAGIKSLGAEDIELSDNLYFEGLDYYLNLIDENFKNNEMYRIPVVNYIKKIIGDIGLSVTVGMNSGGDIELVEAGSSSRGTNVPNSGFDFDFTVRMNPNLVWKIKDVLESIPCDSHITRTSAYKVRLQNAYIPGLNNPIDIDFSLTPQKEQYLSTEEALNERLLNIKSQSDEKYRLVIANIMYAKDYLKTMGTYKPSRGIKGTTEEKLHGGIGGIGIENLILQNGGSFVDACREIKENSEGKNFIEFEKTYGLFDFGQDHVATSKRHFPYDNFIMKNMRPVGYDSLVKAANEFLINYDNSIKK